MTDLGRMAVRLGPLAARLTLRSDALKKDAYYDVYFQIGDPTMAGDPDKFDRIGAVRALVAASSDAFHAMLYGHMAESQPGVDVKITDITPPIFRLVLRYIDSLYVDLTWHAAFGVLEVADKYDILGLRQYCLNFIKHNREIVEVLLEDNIKGYPGIGFPLNLFQNVLYHPTQTIEEFQKSVATQLGVVVEEQDLYHFSLRHNNSHRAYKRLGNRFNDLIVEEKNNRIGTCEDQLLLRRSDTEMVRSSSECLICFKYFDTVRLQLTYVGSGIFDEADAVSSAVPIFEKLFGKVVDKPFIVVEEEFVTHEKIQLDEVDLSSSFEECQLISGDILCFLSGTHEELVHHFASLLAKNKTSRKRKVREIV